MNNIEYLIDKSLNGDIDSIYKLLNNLKPLVLNSIKKYFYRKEEFADLVQDGYLEIIKCLESYNPNKGVHFLGYVKLKLKYLYLDKNRVYKNNISLNISAYSNNEKLELLELIEDLNINTEKDYELKESILTLNNSFDSLSYREKQVIYMYYFKEMNIQSIANKLGISYNTVSNTKINGLNRLKKLLKNKIWNCFSDFW